MIVIHTDKGTFQVEVTEGMTVQDAVQKFQDDHLLEIRGTSIMQETKTGRVLTPDELVVDGRYYYFSGFLFNRPAGRR